MKIKVEVELDWIEEDGNIDEEVQHQIIQGVKNSISKACLAKVEKKTQEAIDTGIATAIKSMEVKVSEFFEQWLDTEAVVTDGYGDKVVEASLRDIIKQKFDKAITEQVDSNGRATNGYNGKYSRLEFLTGVKVTEVVNDYLSNYGRDMDKTIKTAIAQGIKTRVSDKFAEMVIGYAKQDHANAKAIEVKS